MNDFKNLVAISANVNPSYYGGRGYNYQEKRYSFRKIWEIDKPSKKDSLVNVFYEVKQSGILKQSIPDWTKQDYRIPADVYRFSEECGLLEVLMETIHIYHRHYEEETSEYNLYLLEETDEIDEDETTREIVFEIQYEGEQTDFSDKFDSYLQEWETKINLKDQEYISVSFHII